MRRAGLPRPVLKWAGGKTQLLDRILPALPEKIEAYYEPFVGGAAVFFALAEQERFERAVLTDRNPELVEVYRSLRDDADAVIRALRRYSYDRDEYYRIRARVPTKPAARAARIIYLNKTGYNGLYRVNRSGAFNVPFGRHKNPNICDKEALLAAARALQAAKIEVGDFEQVAGRARPGDAVYLDPPYLPLSRTANFTAYDRHPFGLDEHRRLARVFAELSRRKVQAVLSNSDTPETRELYAAFTLEPVRVARPINSRASARGPINEILVKNVPPARARAVRRI
jgi:DNA adenine methylase